MPSMSYCMFQNTVLEMDQILNTMKDASTLKDLKLRDNERDAFFELVQLCEQFLAYAEELNVIEFLVLRNSMTVTKEIDLSDSCYT